MSGFSYRRGPRIFSSCGCWDHAGGVISLFLAGGENTCCLENFTLVYGVASGGGGHVF